MVSVGKTWYCKSERKEGNTSGLLRVIMWTYTVICDNVLSFIWFFLNWWQTISLRCHSLVNSWKYGPQNHLKSMELKNFSFETFPKKNHLQSNLSLHSSGIQSHDTFACRATPFSPPWPSLEVEFLGTTDWWQASVKKLHHFLVPCSSFLGVQ